MTLEVGSKYNFSINCSYGTYEKSKLLSECKGVKYKSSKKKVASMKKGVLTAKKKGTTKVTVEYKKQKLTFTVNVVAKKYTKDKRIKEINSLLKELGKAIPNEKKVTQKNRLGHLKKFLKIGDLVESCNKNGFYGNFNNYNGIAYGGYVCPDYKAYYTDSPFWTYCKKRNPISSKSSYAFQINSVAATPETITVRLKENISQDQVFGLLAQKFGTGSDKIVDENQALISTYIYTEVGQRSYKISGIANYNTNQITFTDIEDKGVSVRLPAGEYYFNNYDWSHEYHFNVVEPAKYPAIEHDVVFVDQQEGGSESTQYCGIASAAVVEWWRYTHGKGASYMVDWSHFDYIKNEQSTLPLSTLLCKNMRKRNNEKYPANANTQWDVIFGKGIIEPGSYSKGRNVYYKNNAVNADELKKMYDRLKKGPIIVHRNAGHYSVVYAYHGDKNNLELSGFQVQEVCGEYGYNDASERVNLETWTKYYSSSALYYYLK